MAPFFGNPLVLGRKLGNGKQLIRMTAAQRARHLYVVGATRTGKSKQLEDCVRQDIAAWPQSGCGLLVLDRHGSLYDNLLSWTAAADMSAWPIVPIDLRRDDWIVAYNPLRDRGPRVEPAVIVGNFVRSILHACGQTNMNDTPRLIKWLEGTLLVLHHHGFTLAEALELIASPDVRHAMTSQVEDFVLRSIWQTAPPREADFQVMVESTVNRIRRFLSRRVMRATLGQSDVSLDLGVALEEGHIVLASLATEGAKIDDEDASTFGSLILSDLWMAAKARGKRDEGLVRPFYVYLDEFQEYLNPSMADALDQTSGFGLHMTLAHQFPSQLLRTAEGTRIYNSVMANCRNKICFQLDHNEDVAELALMLFRQQVEPYKIKNEIWGTKVLGHQIQYMDSYTNGTSSSIGGGTSSSVTEGHAHSTGTNWSHTDSESLSIGESDRTSLTDSEGESTSDSRSRGRSGGTTVSHGLAHGENQSQGSNWGDNESSSNLLSYEEGESWGESDSSGDGESSGKSLSHSQTHLFGPPSEKFREDMDEYLDDDNDTEDDGEKLKRRARGYSLTEGESETSGESKNHSLARSSGGNRGRSQGTSLSRGRSNGGNESSGTSLTRSRQEGSTTGFDSSESRALSRSRGSSVGRSHSEDMSMGVTSSDSYGGTETDTESVAYTEGTNTNWSEGENHAITSAPMLIPIMGQELSSITYQSVDEQLFEFAQLLSGQKDRHCVVKLVSQAPVVMVTLTVTPALTTPEWAFEWATFVVAGLGYALPMDEALAKIDLRHASLMAKLMATAATAEPTSWGRPVNGNGNGNGKKPPPPPPPPMINRKRPPKA